MTGGCDMIREGTGNKGRGMVISDNGDDREMGGYEGIAGDREEE